jgi:hypothetical protein
MDHDVAGVLALHTGRFAPAKVALAYLGMHYLAATGDAESPLGGFVCLKLGHW